MENNELEKLLIRREAAQKGLEKAVSNLKGISPMALVTGQINLEGFVSQLESVLHINDTLVTELANRELARHGG